MDQTTAGCMKYGCLTLVVLFVASVVINLITENSKSSPPPRPPAPVYQAIAPRNPTNTQLPLDVYELKIGAMYRTAKPDTPLCPTPNPQARSFNEGMQAIAQIRLLPSGMRFRILQKAEYRGDVWYAVETESPMLRGWFNCVALARNVEEVK